MQKNNCLVCDSLITQIEFPLETSRVGYVCMGCELFAVEIIEDFKIATFGRRKIDLDDVESVEFFSKLYKEMNNTLELKLNAVEKRFNLLDSSLDNIPKPLTALEVWEKIHNEQTEVVEKYKREE